MKKTILLLFILLVGSGSAMADIINIGPWTPANSWSQQWSENGILQGIIQSYNRVSISMTVGTLEYLTVMTQGWSVQGSEMTFAGAHSGVFNFATTFEGNPSAKVEFTYQAFYNDNLLSTQIADWDPATGWTLELPNNCVRMVPEPGLGVLLLCGIAFLAIACWRIRP
jgi:hypothetical protein